MKFKSKNLIWIILLSFATYVASVHTNCDRPPHLENGWTKPLVEDDNGDLVSVTYVCNDGFILQGESELLCNLDTDEWQGEPPTCNSDQTSTERNSKKINIHEIPEDTSIDSEFAKSLDRSCFIEPRIMPPEIENAVVRNLRRQKDGRIFPVAVYTCDEDYELESVDNDRLYCSKRKWIGIYPNCMQLEETYDENGEEEEGEEDEDYDNNNGDEDDGEEGEEEGEEEDAEEEETEDGNVDTEDRPDEIDNEIDNNEVDNNEIDNNDNEIEGAHVDDRVKPETDPSTVTCSDNQGGCDHKCNVIDNRIQCECFAGFKLDVDDGRTCHDINECDNDNGGCESICINQPGSFKCDCEKGLQIDTVGRTKCLDINECLLRNGHGPCQDTCINTFGGYRCSCENLPGTKLAKNGRNCEDAGKCAIRNGGCSQGCVSAAGRIYCLCERGYYLESDRKTCQDIDECADPEISAQCPHGCENTQGSYQCKEDTTIAPPSNVIEGEEDNNNESSNVLEAEDAHENEINISLDQDEREDDEENEDENEDENDRDDNNEQDNEIYDQNILKTCGDGYELDENNRCVDIDECAQGNTGCEFCKNVNGGFECFCPDGFDLADDERTCLDIDECEMESDYDDTDNQETNPQSPCSHECVNTHGSYLCLCPDNFHLQYDHRTCIRDFCEHLTDELNKTKCSHQCHDEKDGYVCSCPPGLQLDTDSKTCLVNNNQCEQENHCSPGVCINTNDGYRCECPSGYIEKAKRCHDENECEIGNHHCSHECRNLDGSYECHCPSGYILAADRRTCQDVDECERDDEGDLCGDMDCINTVGSYKCQCPEGEELITVESGSICREIDLCDSETNGECSHGCKTEQSEVHCFCPDGMKLHADGKHCGKFNKCEIRNGDCSQVCNSEAEVCECHPGFELSDDEQTCVDVNECERENGGCSHICNNLLGSYQCSCPNEGQYLVNDEKTCEFVNECEINNGGCSHKCEYKSGTTRCVCPPGYQFQNGSTKSCEDINECQTNNGGCSYQCRNYEGRHECLCKVGYELGRDKKNCIDVDECIDFNGNCTNICLNLIGSYQCACEAGFQLFDDQHTCIDIDECEESLNDCSHTCVNVPGTYECSCPNGHTLAVDHFTCEDINECETIADCSHGCINEEGSYHCSCNDGHMLHSDNKTCIDIDECHDNSICSHGCVNSIGGFECHCPNGLELDDDSRTCKDINECQLANGNCSHNCENIEGSYRCLCPSGFQLHSDGVTCVDIDECAVRNGDCEHVCTNYDGGHRCDCLDGFMIKEDGRRCDSKDLCIKANGGCEHICKTVDDLIQCDCRNGFKLNAADNTSCVDINECESSHGCQHDCVNVIGSYKCKCRSGHRMNDKGQCIDIDECQYFNGGCSIMAKCINLVGGFRCHCPVGYKLGHDKKTCVEIRDHCQPLSKPKNGEIKCSRSRHKTQLFYKTKCTITCQPGFELIGDEVRQCNGTGHWDQGSSICAPKLCPRLQRPTHGTLTPSNCMTGDTFSGQRCVLHCDPGFKPIDRRTAFCEPPKNWLPNPNLNCMPAVAKLEMIRPYIKCPQNSIILLPDGKKTIHVKLQQPNTNVDWWKYVDSHPPWGKKLEAHLTPGIHTILFKARSPNSNLNDVCRTIITVKETHPPTVVFCPESTVEHLQPNEDSRSIYFKEPVFKSEHIKDVYKSKLPGEKLGPGEHVIRYVATDLDDQSAKCEFTISVKPYFRRIIHHNEVIKAKPLKNHESYIKCPGKPAVKIDTNFPINLSRGCLIKNIRIPAYSHIRRRHHPSSSNSVLRHYSSWDNPDKPASFIHQYRRGWD